MHRMRPARGNGGGSPSTHPRSGRWRRPDRRGLERLTHGPALPARSYYPPGARRYRSWMMPGPNVRVSTSRYGAGAATGGSAGVPPPMITG